MHIQLNFKQNADMFLPRNFYRTILASGYLRVKQQANVESLIHINNSQSRIIRLHPAVSTENLQSDWNFSSLQVTAFHCDERLLSSNLTACVPSNSEYQRMKPCVHTTIEFESWNLEGGRGGERYVTVRAKTENYRLYCQSRLVILYFPTKNMYSIEIILKYHTEQLFRNYVPRGHRCSTRCQYVFRKKERRETKRKMHIFITSEFSIFDHSLRYWSYNNFYENLSCGY
jgi:hypothetical protein